MKKNKRYAAIIKPLDQFPEAMDASQEEEPLVSQSYTNIHDLSAFLCSKEEKNLPLEAQQEDPSFSEQTASTALSIDLLDYAAQEGKLQEALHYLQMELIESLQTLDHKREIEALAQKIEDLRNQLNNQEKDVLICENAKLKLKLKEKSYEAAELKDQLKREQNQNRSLFAKLFKKTNPQLN